MDKNRRNFFKIILIGGGVFVAGKILGPVFSRLVDTRLVDTPSVENNFESFRTVEDKKGLTVYDKNGEEVFQIDKGE